MGKRVNPMRRKQMAALKLLQVERNRQHPAIRSPKGLSVSNAHTDSLMVASHTPGFTGAGRGVGRETRVISAQGNVSKSFIDMGARGFAPMHDRPLAPTVPEDVRKALAAAEDAPRFEYTGPKSKPFREDDYRDATKARVSNTVEHRKGKGRFKRL